MELYSKSPKIGEIFLAAPLGRTTPLSSPPSSMNMSNENRFALFETWGDVESSKPSPKSDSTYRSQKSKLPRRSANPSRGGKCNPQMTSIKQVPLPSITRVIQPQPNDSPTSQYSKSPKPCTVTGRARMPPSRGPLQVDQSHVSSNKQESGSTRWNEIDETNMFLFITKSVVRRLWVRKWSIVVIRSTA